jgi:TM2 domain-containing membrane protein YozV
LKATWLSLLLPGLGQLYVGRRAEGLVRLMTAVGIICAILLVTVGPAALRSWISVLILELAYLSLWIASLVDMSGPNVKTRNLLPAGENTWFIVMMLVMAGPMGLPLLWHSRQFSRSSKIVWTLVVISVLVMGILFVIFLGPQLDSLSSAILHVNSG